MAFGVPTQSSDVLPKEGGKSNIRSYYSFPAKDGKFMELDNKKRMTLLQTYASTWRTDIEQCFKHNR